MPGLSAPSFQQSIPRQVVDTAFKPAIAFCYANGKIFNCTISAGANSVVGQWNDPYDLTNFTQITLPGGTGARIFSACYDSTRNLVYFGNRITTTGTPKKASTIYSLNPDTGATAVVVNAGEFNGNPSITGQIGHPICTDGSYIYALLAVANGNQGLIAKYSCIDGSVAATIALTAAPSGDTSFGSTIGLLNSTTLYCAGGSNASVNGWAAILPTSLGSVTNVVDLASQGPSVFLSASSVVIGSNVWFADFVTGASSIFKCSSDLNTIVQVPVGNVNGTSGLSYDGTYLWALDDLSGRVAVVDPSSNAVVAVHTEVVPTLLGAYRNVLSIPGAFIVQSYDTGAVLTSRMCLVPTGDGSSKPPLFGHGAC